jgi:hypothetical protein
VSVPTDNQQPFAADGGITHVPVATSRDPFFSRGRISACRSHKALQAHVERNRINGAVFMVALEAVKAMAVDFSQAFYQECISLAQIGISRFLAIYIVNCRILPYAVTISS